MTPKTIPKDPFPVNRFPPAPSILVNKHSRRVLGRMDMAQNIHQQIFIETAEDFNT